MAKPSCKLKFDAIKEQILFIPNFCCHQVCVVNLEPVMDECKNCMDIEIHVPFDLSEVGVLNRLFLKSVHGFTILSFQLLQQGCKTASRVEGAEFVFIHEIFALR